MNHMAQNRITKLVTQGGQSLTSLDELDHHIISFFKSLLSEEDWFRRTTQNQLLDLIPTLISLDQNQLLTKPISEEEVHTTIS